MEIRFTFCFVQDQNSISYYQVSKVVQFRTDILIGRTLHVEIKNEHFHKASTLTSPGVRPS